MAASRRPGLLLGLALLGLHAVLQAAANEDVHIAYLTDCSLYSGGQAALVCKHVHLGACKGACSSLAG